ncbi:hypothetical protein GWN26_00005, partial [Candidatus Saccharibacteria bacterium]|nr:hypothetical protein [Candidatus Saccharibacteria bacterium]
MENITLRSHHRMARKVADGIWQIFIFVLLAFSLIAFASDVSAAQINYVPNGITVDADPGQAVMVPVSVSLSATTLPNYYASFGLVPSGGTLDQSWISRTYVSLNSWYKTRQVFLRVSPPVDAAAGSYSVVLS